MMRSRSGWSLLAATILAASDLPARVQEGHAADTTGPRITLNLDELNGGEEQRAWVVWSGTPVRVAAVGEPGSDWAVQLGYHNTVVRQIPLRLDEKGMGECLFEAPNVRVRTRCELAVTGRRTFRRKVDVLPPEPLAGRLEGRRVGVIDARGRLQKALGAERLPFDDLSTRLSQDAFEGALVLMAGFDDPILLKDACQRLKSRIGGGMRVIVINPPTGWEGWGITAQEPPDPVAAPVRFHEEFGGLMEQDDLGTGPWRRVLRETADAKSAPQDGDAWRTLAWIVRSEETAEGKREELNSALIATRRVGGGSATVALLPELEFPGDGVVGRGMLDELVLSALKPPGEKGK